MGKLNQWVIKTYRRDYVDEQANINECLITCHSKKKNTSGLGLLVFFTFINIVLKRA